MPRSPVGPSTDGSWPRSGFLGKVLGPLGMLQLVATGVWPARAASLCLTNDLVWWIPFALYLRDAWPLWRATWRA